MIEEESKNFKLIGHDPSAAFGCGSLVEVRNGHAYVGSVGVDGVEGFTVHDVQDPRKPRKVWEFKAPPGIHMHKLRYVHENLLYVNSERLPGDRGANSQGGFYIFDITIPHTPRQVGFVNMPGSGPHRFGVDNVRHLAFMPSDAPGWEKRVIWTMDIKNPLKPEVVSVWGLPWQKSDGGELGNDPVPGEKTCTLHGPPMIRGDRMFAGFWGGGMAVIDCADLTDMKLVGHINWTPPFVGCTHTVWPIGNRPYLVVTDEARGKQNYWDSQFMWIVDIRNEATPTPVSTWFPEREKYFNRGGRFGAHNILENITDGGPWANIVFITYFNAGLRAVDVSDALRPTEVGCFVPGVADGERAVQANDVGVDDRGLLYVIDRWGKGMHIVEYTG